MSLKLGVMIGLATSRENWLTFGGDRSWMLDHFPTSLTIAEYRIFIARRILTCDIDIANLSVRLSVTFRYQMKTA